MENRCPIVLDTQGSDVHAEGARIRAMGPVAPVELPAGVRAWSVTGYHAAKQVLGDTTVAKNPKRWTAYTEGRIPPNWPLIGWLHMDNMTTNDGEDHARLRKLVSHAFTPRRVADTRPLIERAVADLLDGLGTHGPDEVVDIKGEFATPLPARVICDMFGVPESARASVLRGAGVNVSTNITGDVAEANVAQWHDELFELADYKRTNPGEDLTSVVLAAMDDDGAGLTAEEMVGTLHLMLGAGSETLMNALSAAVIALLTQPDQREALDAGDVTWVDVIEETLRVQAPVAQLPLRYATQDVTVGDTTIPAGDPILIGFAAIGRDPEIHGGTAAEFRADRENKTHLSFGHGAHFCLGAPLARLELKIALPALFARYPRMSMAVALDELEPQGSFIMNGHRSVPVRLGPEAVAGV